MLLDRKYSKGRVERQGGQGIVSLELCEREIFILGRVNRLLSEYNVDSTTVLVAPRQPLSRFGPRMLAQIWPSSVSLCHIGNTTHNQQSVQI